MSPAKQESINVEAAIRILKIATCPTLSESSTLTYHVGCNAKSDIYFRIFANSGNGYFNVEWVSMESIGKVLGDASKITSFSLQPVFKGKSLNNGGLLLSALKHEGLVSASEDKSVRTYQLGDPAKFMTEVKALIETSVNLNADTKPAKKPSKKKAASEPAPSAT